MVELCARYVVFSHLKIRPNRNADFRAAIATVAASTMATGEASRFAVFDDPEANDRVLLYGVFADEPAWKRTREDSDIVAAVAAAHGAADQDEGGRTVWEQIRLSDELGIAPAPGNFVVVVRFRARPEHLAAFVQQMREDAASMHRAARIVHFNLHRDPADPLALAICARWRDQQAWSDHQPQVDYAAFRERTVGAMQRKFWRAHI